MASSSGRKNRNAFEKELVSQNILMHGLNVLSQISSVCGTVTTMWTIKSLGSMSNFFVFLLFAVGNVKRISEGQ